MQMNQEKKERATKGAQLEFDHSFSIQYARFCLHWLFSHACEPVGHKTSGRNKNSKKKNTNGDMPSICYIVPLYARSHPCPSTVHMFELSRTKTQIKSCCKCAHGPKWEGRYATILPGKRMPNNEQTRRTRKANNDAMKLAGRNQF
jgi:hypothetical protein